MIELARQFGRYGYRRIAALLREAGWSVSDGRIERLWRREGLKVPQKQSKKGRLWLNDGSCVRLRPKYRNHVWSYDFVHCRTDDGKLFRTLNILDEFSRECLAIKVDRKLNSARRVLLSTPFIVKLKATLSITFKWGNKAYFWNIIAVPRLAGGNQKYLGYRVWSIHQRQFHGLRSSAE